MKTFRQLFRLRHGFLLGLTCLGLALIIWRLLTLHLVEKNYLQHQGDVRTLRKMVLPAQRGFITDRHGEALAISTPVVSIWVNPTQIDLSEANWKRLSQLLKINLVTLKKDLTLKKNKQFVYLKRRLAPLISEKIAQLNLTGLHLKTEYQRFYPAGEIMAHVVGTTNVDEKGIQGLELAFDEQLKGRNGFQRIRKDAIGSKIQSENVKTNPQSGQEITLSIDSRLQYLAYKELKKAVKQHRAVGGSIVVLNPRTGEILAMVNQPSYNPNARFSKIDSRFRNRAVTDQFEPGSVIKPLSIAYLLKKGLPDKTNVETSPGWIKIENKVVRDIRNFGKLDLEHILQKSSNVGLAKLIIDKPAQGLYDLLHSCGFGQPTYSQFPGERGGFINPHANHSAFNLATLSFGYGMVATTLQIAQAYAMIANNGIKPEPTFLKGPSHYPSQKVLEPHIAKMINKMLQLAVAQGGAQKAQVHGFTVAGKTGTVRKVNEKGYSEDSHISLFAGFAPAHSPQLVVVVMIDDPKAGYYYGGQVAAPVFSRVMGGGLRLLNVANNYNR